MIIPCLWFDDNAEQAVKFYASIFKKSKVRKIFRFGKEGFEIHGRPAGSVMAVDFELSGQRFSALNGGPAFKFNEAVSFQVSCRTQKEADYYWDKLSADGDKNAQQCGWLKDRYGLSWQIVPGFMEKMFGNGDRAASDRVMKEMLKMKRLDFAALKKAYKG